MAKTKVHGEYLQDSVVRFTAKAGENITKGQPVYISGISGELPVVSLADADDTAKMPAFGLAEATVSTNAEVEVTSFGTLAGLDTSTPGYSLGDILFVNTTAGALTNDPAGLEATKLQNIGIVQRVHPSNGSIKVGGAGRTNAVPNLNDGDIFIGDANNKAVSSSLTTEIESYLDTGTSTPTFSTVGIGTSGIFGTTQISNTAWSGGAPYGTVLTVTGNNTYDANWGHLLISDSTTTTGNGGMIRFATGSTSSDMNPFAGIDGFTEGSAYGGLKFLTRPSGGTATERMTIDSSGHVMVNTDNTLPADNNVEGISLTTYNGGLIQTSRSSQPALTVNRISTDGSVALFKKDGTTVGSIGSYSGSGTSQFYIAGADTGFKINSTVDVIAPSDASGGSRDAAITLGDTGARWKDLYLSGGVYVGGTTSANYLDDYEEGSWTPVLKDDTASTTYTHAVGRYIKIGNMVQAWFHVDVGNYDATAASNTLGIEGLPFTSSNTTNDDYGSVSGLHCNLWDSTSKPDNALISKNTNHANFYKSQGQTGIEPITHDHMRGGNILGCFHYRSA